MVKQEKKIIDLKELLEGKEEELEVPDLGIVKVRTPTVKDRIDALNEVTNLPFWDKLDPISKDQEIGRALAKRCIIEPKISDEQYKQMNELKVRILLDTVAQWLTLYIKDLDKKRRPLINYFLQQMKVG